MNYISHFYSGAGISFAITIFMILVITRMKVLPEKRMELSQTIASLSSSIKMEKGCQRFDFSQSIEDENRLFLLEEWDTQENLMTHMKSEHLRVFRGAMNLLKEPYESCQCVRNTEMESTRECPFGDGNHNH